MILRKTETNFIFPSGMQDSRLSWKARGLLGYLLSLPEEQKVNLQHLINQAPDGKDSLMTGLAELRKHRYIVERLVYGSPRGEAE